MTENYFCQTVLDVRDHDLTPHQMGTKTMDAKTYISL
jgi:hypothetical protein